jgi:hypothetical protein
MITGESIPIKKLPGDEVLKFTKLIRLVFFASEYILFANDLYICSVADFTGTFKGPMKGLDGQ